MERATTTMAHEDLTPNHHDTLMQIFQHPVSHNIEWHAVESLLGQVGTIEHEHDGRFKVTLGDETETFDKPKHKDIDAQQVVDLRRMLKNAGFAPTEEDRKRED
jgi:hypothetical protein